MNRSEFLDMAGGIYKSNTFYSDWSSKEKKKFFWDFFDQADDEFIHSVYAGVSVDLLRRKKRYSIEHIIPKSFLKTYLKKTGVELDIVRGATTNPLNFAAAERGLNSHRRHWPFDVENDKVVRSYNIEMDGIFSDFGFDNEKEWVIPMRTQGDLARSILYMCVSYGISELYGEHINTYRNWAKVDPPNIWEIKYNEWVANQFGIRNPFVADFKNPAASFRLLEDRELMESISMESWSLRSAS